MFAKPFSYGFSKFRDKPVTAMKHRIAGLATLCFLSLQLVAVQTTGFACLPITESHSLLEAETQHKRYQKTSSSLPKGWILGYYLSSVNHCNMACHMACHMALHDMPWQKMMSMGALFGQGLDTWVPWWAMDRSCQSPASQIPSIV